jgi:hypothetical protein
MTLPAAPPRRTTPPASPPPKCPKLKKPTVPTVQLPFGAQLKGIADFSQGLPTQCSLNFSLLVQLQPLLAAMACMLKVLNVIGKMEAFVKAAKNPPTMVDTVDDLLKAIDGVRPCLPPLAFPQLAITIKQILQLIVGILQCLVAALDSILEFQQSIDIESAAGNPALENALRCAQDNASASMDSIGTALEGLQPILEMVTMIAGIAGISLNPIVVPATAGADAFDTVQSLRDTIDALAEVIDAIPLP